MSNFKDRITKQVEIIHDTISDDNERAIVLGCIQDMIKDFTTHVVQLTERQNEIDGKLSDVFDILTNIESTINDEENDEIFGTCPYCGEEIPLMLKDGEFADIECPNCHNTIEMEMAYEYDNQSGCMHDGCGSCCGGSCSINDEDDNLNNDCKKRKK